MKRGREYHGSGEEYDVKRESNIIFSLKLRLLGRISSGKGDGHFLEESQYFKKGFGEE